MTRKYTILILTILMMCNCTRHIFIDRFPFDTITTSADREYLLGYLICRPISDFDTLSQDNNITFEIHVIEKYFTQQTNKNSIWMQKALQEDGILKLDTIY